MPDYNPIAYVGSQGTTVKCPSSFQWELDDISAADAGRTEDTVMHKKRIGQVVALSLGWNNVTTAEASAILTAFNPEYITVSYLDPKAGTYVESEFYVGNRTAPMYNARLGLWSNISFKIVERSGT